MLSFPKLKTGAVQQYPARRSLVYATRALRFVDGSEQRFPVRGTALRKWQVRLEKLDETELAAIEELFAATKGTATTFSFVDPMDETTYETCSFDSDSLEVTFEEVARGRLSLTVRECVS